MLMAHTDVVPAPDADWTVPPFAAEIRDARVLGRGAADMKGELAARAAAFAELARSGVVPPGDVVLIAERTRSATPPTSGCRGSSASARTSAATSR